LNPVETLRVARGALLGYHFRIMKEDASAGTLRTHPLSGAQCFEFWREDSQGRFNTLESSLHSVQRTVEIRLRAERDGTLLSCAARTERLSVPGHGMESRSQAYRMLSDSHRGMQRLKFTPHQEQNMEWIDLGLDPLLSEHIAAEILRRAKQQAVQVRTVPQGETRG